MSRKARAFMNMKSMIAAFQQGISVEETAAATAASSESRVVFNRWLGERPVAPPRLGRPTTSGAFASYLEWKRDGKGNIEFDVPGINSQAPYWLIQEIGTGQSARITNPTGQVSVRSQRGRHIPMSLYWASGPGAATTRPTSGKQRQAGGIGFQQLYPISGVTGHSGASQRAGTIRREIKGKHYLRDGGREGFDVLRTQLFKHANKAFR